MTSGIQAITGDERRTRMEKARRLMRVNKIGTIFLEGDSSMFYFTGTRWGHSERALKMMGLCPARSR
jgi:Xaa-Pro dipeptidase